MKQKMTVLDFKKFKEEGRKFAYCTAYDYTTASIVDESDVEVILVGDCTARGGTYYRANHEAYHAAMRI